MFGITLRAAGEATPFWELVDRASALEQASSIRALGYPPHITLTRYPEIDPEPFLSSVEAFEGSRTISLTFDRIGVFDADPLVLWLAPRRHLHLIDLHSKVHGIIDPAMCDPYYRPLQWIPHLTIAMSISIEHRSRALEFAARPIEPFSLTFDALEWVSWPPLRILRSAPLSCG